MTGSQLGQIVIILVLLVSSALLSATETAFFSAKKARLRHLAEEGNERAILANRLLEKPGRVISTVLVGNNAVNIGATALATTLAISFFGDTGAGVATVVMTLVILIFSEITPKTLAAARAEDYALKLSKPINAVAFVLSPLVKALNVLTGALARLFGGEAAESPLVTEEEIRMLVNVGQEEGLIDRDESEMINSIFEFDDTLVREVMTPRIDIIAINAAETLDNVIKVIVAVGHSRIPVFDNTVDDIVGVLYAKDLFEPLLGKADAQTTISQLMRPAYYVPESKKVRDLFAELRKEKVHMAIVLDEYGGTAGIVTIEDLIEEIVGDIQDEFDREEKNIEVLADGTLLVDARTSIYDINEILKLDLPDDEFDTIGGLAFHILGRLAHEGQELEIADLHATVAKIEGRRIVKLKLQRNDGQELE